MGIQLGFALFFIIGLMAMWMLVFLATIAIPYWVTLSVMDKVRPKSLPGDEDKE